MKHKYTKEQIKECISYLGYGVKEGYIDESAAQEIIRKKDWKYVYEMIDRADAYADAAIRGEQP